LGLNIWSLVKGWNGSTRDANNEILETQR
jgi:hypothetical protein